MVGLKETLFLLDGIAQLSNIFINLHRNCKIPHFIAVKGTYSEKTLNSL